MIIQPPIRFAAAAIVLLVTLFFGLNPKGYDFSNHVNRLPGGPGIHFGKYGLAYANLDNDLFSGELGSRKSFSLQLAIMPASPDGDGFNFITAIHNGRDNEQLLVGQWHSSVIVMNGDDYAHRQNTKRLTAKIVHDTLQPVVITVTSSAHGSSLYINGKAVQSDPEFTLLFPEGNQNKLTFGNSVYLNATWQGEIHGYALYDFELSPAQIKSHFESWSQEKRYTLPNDDHPALLYQFAKKKGGSAADLATGRYPLIIPQSSHLLQKIFFQTSLARPELNASLFLDIVINLLGFIPMGFVIATLFVTPAGTLKKSAILWTVALCFSLSMLIEAAQAWLPSRSSQSLDVLLNTAGSLIGALVIKSCRQVTWMKILILPAKDK